MIEMLVVMAVIAILALLTAKVGRWTLGKFAVQDYSDLVEDPDVDTFDYRQDHPDWKPGQRMPYSKRVDIYLMKLEQRRERYRRLGGR